MMNADFADNFLMPRASNNGQELPNPRGISLRIHTGKMIKSRDVSNMFSQWGQFLGNYYLSSSFNSICLIKL